MEVQIKSASKVHVYKVMILLGQSQMSGTMGLNKCFDSYSVPCHPIRDETVLFMGSVDQSVRLGYRREC